MATVVDEFVANFNLPPLPEEVQASLDRRLDALMGTDAAKKEFLDRRGTLAEDQRTLRTCCTPSVLTHPSGCEPFCPRAELDI
jgi:hypothetical protein